MLRALLTFGVLLALFPLRAWDTEGHEIIARIAYDRLNPKAKAELDKLALEVVRPGSHYDAISLSIWMDDLRHKRTDLPYQGKFLTWHYINIGLEPKDPVPDFEPGHDNDMKGNVVTALKRVLVVLQGGTDPYVTSKAMAAAMAEHLVGDIHQPLHAGTEYWKVLDRNGQPRSDQGGNRLPLSNAPRGEHPPNLHFYWDGAYRATFDEATGQAVFDPISEKNGDSLPEDILAMIKADDAMKPVAPKEIFDFVAWAKESNQIAKDVAYGQLMRVEGQKETRLSSAYVATTRKVARERLALAGIRLAMLLNATLGADTPGPVPPSYPAGPPAFGLEP